MDVVEQHLEEGAVAQGALQMQLFYQFFHWYILMGKGVQHHLAALVNELEAR